MFSSASLFVLEINQKSDQHLFSKVLFALHEWWILNREFVIRRKMCQRKTSLSMKRVVQSSRYWWNLQKPFLASLCKMSTETRCVKNWRIPKCKTSPRHFLHLLRNKILIGFWSKSWSFARFPCALQDRTQNTLWNDFPGTEHLKS